MILTTEEQDAAGRYSLEGAAAASNHDEQADEDDDAGQGVITSGYVPGADGLFGCSAPSDRFRGPTDVNEIQ